MINKRIFQDNINIKYIIRDSYIMQDILNFMIAVII